jgi:hypothetical protein
MVREHRQTFHVPFIPFVGLRAATRSRSKKGPWPLYIARVTKPIINYGEDKITELEFRRVHETIVRERNDMW